MNDPSREAEYVAEAERLKLLPASDQREVIALYRTVAAGKRVPASEGKAGLERAAALERLLGLAKKKRKTR
jgi:hypothetical protein